MRLIDADMTPDTGKRRIDMVGECETVCHCNVKKNAELIAQILDYDVCSEVAPFVNEQCKMDNMLESPRRWITCSERLPKLGERVLTTDGAFVGEMYINKRGQWQRYNVVNHETLMALDILYWMPLPEPPEEVRQ